MKPLFRQQARRFLVVMACLLPLPMRGAVPSERIILLPPLEHTAEDLEIARWQERVKAPLAEPFHFERLGWAFVAKARRTQDTGYFKQAEAVADVMAARFGPSPDGLLLRGHVLHNLHCFADAETLARALVRERGLAWDYALWSDCLMELGRIDEAVEACQKAVDLRPGPESFARVAHLRWVKGDLAGADSALIEALGAAASVGSETRAWFAVRLSAYRLQAGAFVDAQRLAERANVWVPDYPPALLAVGRSLLAQQRAGDALPYLLRAADLNPLPEYLWWLADALRITGDESKAREVEENLVERGEASDPRTLSLFLATRGRDPRRAVGLAEAEISFRRDVFTHDALAWARFLSGDAAGAERALQAALAAGTLDARLYLHAGMIAAAAGLSGEASRRFQVARKFSGSLTPSERTLLTSQSLAASAPAVQNRSGFLVGN